MADRKGDDGRWMYDVFLSFRGEDTRKNFTDHLYYALKNGGINVYRDDNELPRGEHITTELEQAIQKSKIAIIVFSKGYADSRWCMEELVKIMECKRTMNHLVLPVFYDVDPSDVRNQKGTFEKTFARHEQRFISDHDKVLNWRMTLNEATNLAGFHLKNTADGHEGKFIKKIVQKISNDLITTIDVARYQVGIDSRVNAITSELDVGLGGVRMIGIWGMGGVGKTTIAKVVYNLLYNDFEGACFLDNIKDNSKQLNGLVHLQEKLLKAIFKSSKVELQNVDEGIIQLRQRLPHKKVMLILDDIDDTRQLNALARSRDWYGAGSRIIITTRDEHLLKSNLEVDAICKIDELNEIEALELLSWHAFHSNHPSKDFYQLSKHVVSYCGGLPLALEVLGSFLRGRTIAEWEGAMNKLKKNPDGKIQKQLIISFDDLDDQTKDIFLDISCFFIGMDKNEVTQIMDGCGFFPIIGISVLLQRCLLKVDHENKFMMNDLLRDMGREIVRNESPKELEKRSRLFVNDDVLNLLEKQKGTDITEGLSLKLSISDRKHLHTKAFKAMQKLRLLQLNYTHIRGDFKHFSQELRWLCWHGYPLASLPKNFHLEKVVAIDLRYSHLIKFFSKKPKLSLEELTVLNLSHSHYLTCTPNFSKLPHLEKLKLKDCKSLTKVDNSIGSLQKLVFINLKDCICLNKLPDTLSELKSLETLILSGCSKLESLPNDLGKMESLKTLAAEDTCIRQLPSTIVRLKTLSYLSLNGCKRSPSKPLAKILWSWIFRSKILNSIVLPTSLRGLESLTTLHLKNCNLSDDAIPKDIGSLVSLAILDLGGNDFHALPSSISSLSKLISLDLGGCSKLEQISNLPPNLKWILAVKCKALKSISVVVSKTDRRSYLKVNGCPKLVEISGFDEVVPYISSVRTTRWCNLYEIPQDIGSLVSLCLLDDLGGSDFHRTPSSISRISNLIRLCLDGCSKVEQISNLPPRLKWIFAQECKALQCISLLSKVNSIHQASIDDYSKLVEISGFDEQVSYNTLKSVPKYAPIVSHSKLHQSFKENILQRMFVEINQGIKLRSFPDGLVFDESNWLLYLEASQIADFDFRGSIHHFTYELPGEFPSLKWLHELPKVEDGASGMTHTIGKTCFDLSGRSSERCILICKYYGDAVPGCRLWLKCIKFNFLSRTWFPESAIHLY